VAAIDLDISLHGDVSRRNQRHRDRRFRRRDPSVADDQAGHDEDANRYAARRSVEQNRCDVDARAIAVADLAGLGVNDSTVAEHQGRRRDGLVQVGREAIRWVHIEAARAAVITIKWTRLYI